MIIQNLSIPVKHDSHIAMIGENPACNVIYSPVATGCAPRGVGGGVCVHLGNLAQGLWNKTYIQIQV